MSRFSLIHQLATRNFPLGAVELMLCTVTLAIGNRVCDDIQLDEFVAYWSVLCVLAFASGALTGWTLRVRRAHRSLARHLLSVLADGVQATLYFVAISLCRAKPFECAAEGGHIIAHRVGPSLLIAIYASSIGYYTWRIVSSKPHLDDDQIESFVSMTPVTTTAPTEEAALATANKEMEQVLAKKTNEQQYTLTLLSSVALHMRKKVPLMAIVFHFVVVALFVRTSGGPNNDVDDACNDTNYRPTLFALYLAAIMTVTFVRGCVRGLATQLGHASSRSERVAYALSEGLLSALLLFAFVLMRAEPIKCLEHGGLALAYATSVPLLLLAHALALVSSYLLLRTYSLSALQQLGEMPWSKKD
jgi:hypothetical protein